MSFSFDESIFDVYSAVMVSGIAAGFVLGFIAWAIGYAVYAIIKFIKVS